MIKSTKRQQRHSVNPARKWRRFLEERQKNLSPLLILTPDCPDPHAIASALALQHLAQTVFGIESHDVFVEYGNVATKLSYIAPEGFGWMNASFAVGLNYLSPTQLVALRDLKSPPGSPGR